VSLQVLNPQRELARVRPNKWRYELLLQVVYLLQLEELLGQVLQLADLTLAPVVHRRQPGGGIGGARGRYSLATCSSNPA
jgi:hypothetical protein